MDVDISKKFKESGIGFFKAGQFDDAIKNFILSLDDNSNDIEVLSMLADSFVVKEQDDLAMSYYKKVLDVDPINTRSLLKLSALELQGANYLDVLSSAHQNYNPKRYIEIGVCKGVSFGLANEQTIAIGIDPEPQLDTKSLPEKHRVASETSDEYFDNGHLKKDFNGKPFDMAFLDGMHLFEYALRDFINLEKQSHSESVIFVHDVYPMNAETSTRERNSDFWSGDVWKLVLCVSEYRKDLDLKVLPCPPTGLGMIKNLDSSSTVLSDNYQNILKKYIDMSYDEILNEKEEKLKLTNAEEIIQLFT